MITREKICGAYPICLTLLSQCNLYHYQYYSSITNDSRALKKNPSLALLRLNILDNYFVITDCYVSFESVSVHGSLLSVAFKSLRYTSNTFFCLNISNHYQVLC